MISVEFSPRIRNDFFEKFLDQKIHSSSVNNVFKPKAKIVETENEFFIIVELPGLSKQEIKLTVEKNVLTIKGSKNSYLENNENSKIILNELSTGDFIRKFNLTDEIDSQNIIAKFENGNLIIQLKKIIEKQLTKEIKVL